MEDNYDWNHGSSTDIPGHGEVSDNDGIYLRDVGGANDFALRGFWNTSVGGSITENSFWFNSNNVNYEIKKKK